MLNSSQLLPKNSPEHARVPGIVTPIFFLLGGAIFLTFSFDLLILSFLSQQASIPPMSVRHASPLYDEKLKNAEIDFELWSMLKKLASQAGNFYTHQYRCVKKTKRAYIVNVRLLLRCVSKSTLKIALPSTLFHSQRGKYNYSTGLFFTYPRVFSTRQAASSLTLSGSPWITNSLQGNRFA